MFILGLLATMTILFGLGVVGAYRQKQAIQWWVAITMCWVCLFCLALWHLNSDPQSLRRNPTWKGGCFDRATFTGDRLDCPSKSKP
jgi:hypothetical protein